MMIHIKIDYYYIQLFYMSGKITDEELEALQLPFINNFYLESDGKSNPLSCLKVIGFQQHIGIKKDVLGVYHDWLYSVKNNQSTNRKKADQEYLRLGKKIYQPLYRPLLYVEYFFLRLFGGFYFKKS